MDPQDPLPDLVRGFTEQPRGPTAAPLLDEVTRHVGHVSRRYPDAWFALGRKDDAAIADLGDRVFTVCAAVRKGRFPFQGRAPFVAYVEERMEGRAIRYHSFYAKLSITRELMRDDYAKNIVRDPVLRWRAELYRAVGDALAALADAGEAASARRGRGVPLSWQRVGEGPRLARPAEDVAAALQRALPADVPALVALALDVGGPTTQSRLTQLLEGALGTPAAAEPPAPEEAPDLPTRMAVREAVVAVWSELDDADRSLLTAVARGESYDVLVARDPRFKHKVAVTRAVKRCGARFVDRVLRDLGLEGAAAAPPQRLIEAVVGVLEDVLPATPAAEVAR